MDQHLPGPFHQVDGFADAMLFVRDAEGRTPAFQGFLQVRVGREGFDLQELVQHGRNHRGFSPSHLSCLARSACSNVSKTQNSTNDPDPAS
jgi:hypothetical protein